MLSPADFVRVIEVLLQAAFVRFELRDLQDFVAGCWPHIECDPDPRRWAQEFADAHATVRPCR